MTAPGVNVTFGVEALVDTARRQGLLWRMLPGSVVRSASSGALFVLIDNDESPIICVSLIGNALVPGLRVMVLIAPPQGNYVMGVLGSNTEQILGSANANGSIGADSTTSGSNSNLGTTNLNTSFTKKFDATKVCIDLSVTCFSTIANTDVGLSVHLLGGNNVAIVVAQLFLNVANTHMQVSGHALDTTIPAGTFTVQIEWYRVSGTGVLTTDANDWASYTIQEIW